jgi:DNA-binding phage protein
LGVASAAVSVMKRSSLMDVNELAFDPVPYLTNEMTVDAYLGDVLQANDGCLLASALEDIAELLP